MVLKNLLDRLTEQINVPEFIKDDPVSFPRRFSSREDIEIVSLLVSHISWGKREMILRDAGRMLALMDDNPFQFVREGDFSAIDPEKNIHRTFFGRDLLYFLRGLRRIYSDFGSLENFASKIGVAGAEFPSWKLAEGINAVMDESNCGGFQSIRCLPRDLGSTALKRLNMALRWLVRDDGIVDMGVWKVIKPSQLYIPLDVHVGNIGRKLGLISRKANDRKTVVELTSRLAEFDPTDPVKYDFALFGAGIEGIGISEAQPLYIK